MKMHFLSGKKRLRIHLNAPTLIFLAFLGVMLLGSLLLWLPISAKGGHSIPYADALFTAVSAVCVTGLTVIDVATTLSLFGQFILLLLIQIGGLGVITVVTVLTSALGAKIGVSARSLMQDSISAPQISGIVQITGMIVKGTLIVEGCGALLLLPVFIYDFGVFQGIWMSIFHSVSAFCNAGFDLLGVREPFSSLTSYQTNGYLNTVIMLLIVIGGIGFLVWQDVLRHKWNLRRYSLQSKVALSMSLFLILLPTLLILFFEMPELPLGERFFPALFQSVTLRTAGFNTYDFALFSHPMQLMMIGLMLIGGSPGSTAGGMKTTTLAVLIVSALSVFRQKKETVLFERRISETLIRQASALLFLYLTLFTVGGSVISRIEALPFLPCLFETASAVGTVGLSQGLTPGLSLASRSILVFLMILGRVGGFTFVFVAVPRSRVTATRSPEETVTVG